MFPFLTNPIIRKVFAISNLHNHNHWLLDTLSFLLQRMFPFHRSKYFLSFQIKSFKSKGFWLLKNKKKRKTFPFHHSKIVIAINPNVSPPQKSNHSKICTPASRRRNWGAILLPSFSRLRANCSPFFFFPNVPFSSPWMFPFLKNQPFKELWGLHNRHEEGLSCHFPSLCWSEQETVQNVSCSEKTLDTLSWIGTKRFLYIQIR